MADLDLENEPGEEPGAESPAAGESPRAKLGSGIFSVIAARKMAILQTAIAIVLLGSLAFWIFLMRKPPQQPIGSTATVVSQGTAEPRDEPVAGTGGMAAAKAAEIADLRSELRRENRSERNQAFSKRMDEGDMLRISIRGELALLSSMFSHYVSTTAKFYELFRIMANDYVSQRAQVLEIFEKELMPEYTVTERRRRMMRRRVEHDPAVELYNRLDYIAYHDSIAVHSFREFIEKGGEQQFAQTSSLVSESKFMIEDFRQRLEVRLRDYDMEVEVPETVWEKYFGSWPW